MLYALLFTTAFLFFVADRKIRTSSIAGTCVTSLASLLLTRRILTLTRGTVQGPKGSFYTGVFVTVTLCIFLTAVIVLLLYLLGSLLGKAIMPASKDGSSNGIVASVFYIAGMCLTFCSGLNFMLMSLMLGYGSKMFPMALLRKNTRRFRFYITDFRVQTAGLIFFFALFAAFLFLVLTFCIVRIAVRKGLYKDLRNYVKPDKKSIKRSTALLIGEIVSGVGVLGTFIIAVVCILTPKGRGRIYFFDGYIYTKLLSGLALLLMLAGTVLLIIGLITLLAKKQAKLQKLNVYISCVLILLSCSSSMVLILNAMRYLLKIR